jgi:hypothetical protein
MNYQLDFVILIIYILDVPIIYYLSKNLIILFGNFCNKLIMRTNILHRQYFLTILNTARASLDQIL